MKSLNLNSTHSLSKAPAKASKPFFSKTGEGTFFGDVQTHPEPFFQPPVEADAELLEGLKVGEPNDKFEQEANAKTVVQEQTTANAPLSVQPKTIPEEKIEQGAQEEQLSTGEELQMKPIFESAATPPDDDDIQRKCAECAQEDIRQQTNEQGTPDQDAGDLQSQLDESKGAGNPLSPDTRSSMESAFQADFSGVRVHTDTDAVQMNQQLNAQAFAHGNDIYFNEGKYETGNSAGQELLAHELTHTIQQGASPEQPSVQRQEESGDAEATNTPTGPGGGWIVEDEKVPDDWQLRKTAFLNQLNEHLCAVVDSALAGTRFTAIGCPILQHIFTALQNRTVDQLERLVLRFNPEAHSGIDAQSLIAFIGIRVRQIAANWVTTGEITGLPPELTAELPSNWQEMARMAASSAGGVLGNLASVSGSLLSRLGGLFFKARPGGAIQTRSPEAVMMSLGQGQSMEGSTRRKMEDAFDSSFSDVQIHTDSQAVQLNREMNSRAFTVGNHVAFGGGEYRPGSLVGDALMAHELAHVEQQKGGTKENSANGQVQRQEKEADRAAVQVLLGQEKELGKQVDVGLRTGLSLQRCGGSDPGYEELPDDQKRAVDDYLYEDLLKTEQGEDILPQPLNQVWSKDPFTLSFFRTGKKGDDDPGQMTVKVTFTGRHNRLTSSPAEDTVREYSIPLPLRKAILNVLVEQETPEKIIIWPYGKAPRNARFEFAHEGPGFTDYGNFKGRIHHFTLRSRTSSGYMSGPFYVADKDANPKDYPEEAIPFYADKDEGIGLPSHIYIVSGGSELRLDGDGDYYKELVLQWKPQMEGNNYKYAFRAYYIPSDKSGNNPQTFDFSAPKTMVTDADLADTVKRVTDGGLDTVVSLGDFHDPKLFLSIRPPTAAGGKMTYSWRTNVNQAGSISFPLEAGHKPPESQVEVEGESVSTTRIWAQNVSFGPYRDPFRVTLGVRAVDSNEAFLNLRALKGEVPYGSGGIKVPLSGMGKNDAFSPKVIHASGLSLKLQLDIEGKIIVEIFDRVSPTYPDSKNTDENRRHLLRVYGNTLPEDYFYKYEVWFHDSFKHDGGLYEPYGGSQQIKGGEEFSMDAKTMSLDLLADNKTFLSRLVEYERELYFVRKKAHDEGLLSDNIYKAWVKLNGAVLVFRIESSAANKKELSSALDEFVSAYPKADASTLAALKMAILSGSAGHIEQHYLNLIRPMDQEIVDVLGKSSKKVVKDLGLKAAYLLDLTGEMNAMRMSEPLRIPATFAIKELYLQGKPNYGHALELYAYKKDGRLHVKNLTNRREIAHVETGVPSDKANQSVADLLAETGLIGNLNDPDFFPEGELNYRIPGYQSNSLATEGGMSSTDYAKIIGGVIAVTGLVLIAIASFGLLAPEAAAAAVGVGSWMMLTGDAIVLTAAIVDIIADRYKKGHFDTRNVLINAFDAATAFLSAGATTLGRIAFTGARAAATGAKISEIAKFAGKWYIPFKLAQGAAGAMGVILVMNDAFERIKALSKMEGGEAKNQAAISLFWHLLSIGSVMVLGFAESKRFMPNSTDLLILHFARAKDIDVPFAFLGGIAKFTKANMGEFADEGAALKFIENNLSPQSLEYFNKRYGSLSAADRIARLEGFETAWAVQKVDINGALTISSTKANFRAKGIPDLTDAQFAGRYLKMGVQRFPNWSSTRVNMADGGVNHADAAKLMGVLEQSGFNFGISLNTAQVTALHTIDINLKDFLRVKSSTDLPNNILSLNPHFTTLGQAVGAPVLEQIKIRLSLQYIGDKILLGRQAEIQPAGQVPSGAVQRELIGAHSGRIMALAARSNPDFEVRPKTGTGPVTANSDGTFSVKVRKRIHQGPPDVWTTWKPSTLAPASWLDQDILEATLFVASNGTPGKTIGTKVWKTGVFKGIKWEVLQEGGVITSSYPTGP